VVRADADWPGQEAHRALTVRIGRPGHLRSQYHHGIYVGYDRVVQFGGGLSDNAHARIDERANFAPSPGGSHLRGRPDLLRRRRTN
jgi:hypothetical protein